MRADRLLSLIMLLQARGRMTATELAAELEVSERTVYRDLEALHTAGVPVLAERGPGGGVTLPAKYRTDLTGLTEPEIRGLFMSIVPGPLSALGLDKAIEAGMLKLAASLPAVQRKGVEQVRGRIHVDTAPWFHPGEMVPHLKLLQEAVWQSCRVIVSYKSAGGARSRSQFNPYGLVAKAGIWYLVGVPVWERPTSGGPKAQARIAAQTVEDLMVYRVSRINDAELIDEPFERPDAFDLASFWAEWCSDFEARLPRYCVTVQVAPDMVPALPSIYGDSVHSIISEAGPPDPEGWLTLQLTFQNFEAARSSMLGLGTGAQIVEPAELRESVVRAAASIVASYVGGTARGIMERSRETGDDK